MIMWWIGLLLLLIGLLMFAVGWVLNTNTPRQSALPVAGIVVVVIGIFAMILFW